MLCEDCHEQPATVHFTRIVNDQKTEAHLCADCARKRGEIGIASEPSFTFHNILAGLFQPESMLGRGTQAARIPRCSNCGLSLADFRRLGQFGCNHCYQEFQRELEPILKRIHRAVEHVGKAPGSHEPTRQRLRKEIQRLHERLRRAVDTEAYEEAARIRDQIRELERKIELEPREKG